VRIGCCSCDQRARSEFGAIRVPEVEPTSPSNEHLARNRSGDFFTPKLLLISTILTKLVHIDFEVKNQFGVN